MARILIVYGTTEGHTTAIVERMRAAIEAQGDSVRVERAGDGAHEIPEDVDGVVVGASIHKGKHQAAVVEFASRNGERLAAMPSAFFQVCLTAADPSPEATELTDACLRDFTSTTGWAPERTATFAGMLAWTQYDVFTRVLMKLILRKQQLPPEQLDTSHDFDYTDYEAVERFGVEFARSLDGAVPAA